MNTGHLGVTFFFLISGFLIIPSLERYSTIKSFIIHKIFRLWPTYAVCLNVGVAFIVAFHWLHGTNSPITLKCYLVCLFWARDLMDYTIIDVVVWVLEIQLKFYLCAVIGWHLIKKKYVETFIVIIILLSSITYVLYVFYIDKNPSWFYLVNLARTSLRFFMIILIGTCFYSYQSKQFSPRKTLLFCALLIGTFFSPLFRLSGLPFNTSYIVGTLIMGYFVFSNKLQTSKKGIINRAINWVASISYPFYLGHVLPGYVLMFLMIEAGYSVFWGIGLSLIYVASFSALIHKAIEFPFIKLNKTLTVI